MYTLHVQSHSQRHLPIFLSALQTPAHCAAAGGVLQLLPVQQLQQQQAAASPQQQRQQRQLVLVPATPAPIRSSSGAYRYPANLDLTLANLDHYHSEILTPDSLGWLPVHWAAARGCVEGVVELIGTMCCCSCCDRLCEGVKVGTGCTCCKGTCSSSSSSSNGGGCGSNGGSSGSSGVSRVNARTVREGWSVLHVAVAFRHRGVVELLLKRTDVAVSVLCVCVGGGGCMGGGAMGLFVAHKQGGRRMCPG